MKGRILFKTIAIIAILATIAVATIFGTQLYSGLQAQITQKKAELNIVGVQEKFAVKSVEYTAKIVTVETFAIISTKEEGDGKKYLKMVKLRGVSANDVLERQKSSKGIEKEKLLSIVQTIMERKPIELEGIIETEKTTVEYWIKQYRSGITSFAITQNNQTMFNYIGKTDLVWEILAKIKEAASK